jgi:hypothetical protein
MNKNNASQSENGWNEILNLINDVESAEQDAKADAYDALYGTLSLEKLRELISLARRAPDQATGAPAPVCADERALFEIEERNNSSNLTRRADGQYENPCTQSAWEGWQARAAIAQQADHIKRALAIGEAARYVDDLQANDEILTFNVIADGIRALAGEHAAHAKYPADAPSTPQMPRKAVRDGLRRRRDARPVKPNAASTQAWHRHAHQRGGNARDVRDDDRAMVESRRPPEGRQSRGFRPRSHGRASRWR